ncbi:unnamed protein product [Rotaria magnacalcarata]|uniref:Uncharacterized protein n=1 Tax=Rotaria magnacalcarata TaxID=392030 RepID=A0A816N693_9BILA|nr:unnamed protein product [Rotaria magnacalcarata]CAF1660737.1 unnamed protein product [Rotaria magnacalcarata]CAF2018500.1 unnamed protein product [Rotaria magnacalcarata]CAF2104806.1 unnamed protein product [Rotaria magnacalcarata]CAF3855345.1 unnamed protein product [Rotaria magnacalcarata]
MNADKFKSTKSRLKSNDSMEYHRRKSTEYLFQPIVQFNDKDYQRKEPSSFRTGLKYLKLLGQMKRQNETDTIHQMKPTILDRLERTSAFSTNYYAPLLPASTHLTNKSIQVDDLDDLSYKTAINNNYSYLSFYEFLCSFILVLLLISIVLFLHLNSYPMHCIMHKKYWYPNDLATGFLCENTNIEIHYVEIYSIVYQIEIKRNIKAINCQGFDILSCLPIDYLLVPKGQIIRRNDQLIKYCNRTQKMNCHNHSLNISPYENKWNLKNNHVNRLSHCSCLTDSNNTKCFHFKINSQCNLHIPWFDYCLKHSTTNTLCQAYIFDRVETIVGINNERQMIL